MNKSQITFRNVSTLLWGVLVLFGLVGSLMGKQEGSIIAAIVAIMWCVTRILTEALVAYHLIFSQKKQTDDK